MALAAECLQLLSVEPTGHHTRWYKTKVETAELFGDVQGREYLAGLRQQGVEDGFLLTAELMLAEELPRVREAIDLLDPLVGGDEARKRPRTCRRLAQLMLELPDYECRFEDRYRLLALVESQMQRLTPHEEFQMACLAYQLGRYPEGRRRFAQLRNTGRGQDVAGRKRPYLVDLETGEPLLCRGVVVRLEGGQGWMRLESEKDGRNLFEAPFTRRLFGDQVVVHRTYPAIVRFTEKGPKAVPARFAGGDLG